MINKKNKKNYNHQNKIVPKRNLQAWLLKNIKKLLI